jgi:hypothetical protein
MGGNAGKRKWFPNGAFVRHCVATAAFLLQGGSRTAPTANPAKIKG